MGGKALGSITRRFKKEEYFDLSKELLPKISQAFNTEIHMVQSFRNKEDFGDMDILILNSGNLGIIKNIISKEFNPTAIKCNGNCYSFDYKDLQIDLILITPINWETAKCFYSWGDLGNLMGKIAHRLNLKYGWDGIKHVYYSEGKKLGTIYISRDTQKIFNFLGLDYKTFLRGFDTQEEMFKYVMTSKYFNPYIFTFDNLNHRDKQRNKKRKGYNDFLNYLNINNIYTKYSSKIDLPDWKFEINKWFPGMHLDLICKDFEHEDLRTKTIASKFNGHIVMTKYPELKDKELGNWLKIFKQWVRVDKGDYGLYILNSTPEQIMKDFSRLYTGIHTI